MTVYKKQDIPDKYHLKKHYRVPPLLLEADEGYAIVRVSIASLWVAPQTLQRAASEQKNFERKILMNSELSDHLSQSD